MSRVKLGGVIVNTDDVTSISYVVEDVFMDRVCFYVYVELNYKTSKNISLIDETVLVNEELVEGRAVKVVVEDAKYLTAKRKAQDMIDWLWQEVGEIKEFDPSSIFRAFIWVIEPTPQWFLDIMNKIGSVDGDKYNFNASHGGGSVGRGGVICMSNNSVYAMSGMEFRGLTTK